MAIAVGRVPGGQPTVRHAIQRALPLLQHNAQSWFQKRQCTSCHHHSLGLATFELARERGFAVDDQKLAGLIDYIPKHRSQDRFDQYESAGAINGVAGFSYNLFGYAAAKIPMCDHTDSTVFYILSKQAVDGHWPSLSHRPPLEDSPETLTALAIKALGTYAPGYLNAEAQSAIAHGRAWLLTRKPEDNEKAVFKLFGLAWSKASSSDMRMACDSLLSRQQSDGGWAQLPTRRSDAYATGEALVALNAAGGESTRSSAYRRGVKFLLQTQQADGSWHVTTRRRFPGLPYFESGFPYHEDQFISCAGTNWATMALILAEGHGAPRAIMTLSAPARRVVCAPLSQRPKDDQLFEMVLHGDASGVTRSLDEGADVNARTPIGATPLMLAVKNPGLVSLLLRRGADPNLVSKGGATALLLATGTPSGRESVRLLLETGAKINVIRDQSETPLANAVMSGDIERLDLLLRAGADPNAAGAAAGNMAIVTRDISMLKRLIAHGLNVDQVLDSDGDTLLIYAVMDASTDIVESLLESGANANAKRKDGISALMTAAMVDPGNSRIVRSLLKHGANPKDATPEGKTALSLAHKYGNSQAAEVLTLASG